ncbi:hypothetical protein ACFE04_026087 [Oxalis oulophora]
MIPQYTNGSALGVTPTYTGGFPCLPGVFTINPPLPTPTPCCFFGIDHIDTTFSLTRLDLSFNELSGVVPDELGNLTLLEYLDVSSNKLSGVVLENNGDSQNTATTDKKKLTQLSNLFILTINLALRVKGEKLGGMFGCKEGFGRLRMLGEIELGTESC